MAHPIFTDYGINPNVLTEIKNRIYVVGKFSGTDGTGGAYLFSKTNRQSENYLPGRCLSLDYDIFLKALRPSLTEKHESNKIVGDTTLDSFELVCKTVNGGNSDVPITIDESNYFFQRAISSTPHDAFKEVKPNFGDIIKVDKKQNEGEESRGKIGEGIFIQVRKSLHDFCAFQVKNMELLHKVSELIAANRGRNGIPQFGVGQLLPVNFASVFMDYLYQQELAAFNLLDSNKKSKIDFGAKLVHENGIEEPIWHDVLERGTNDPKKEFRESFSELITQFRNYLLNPEDFQRYTSLRGLEFRSVLNRERFSEELRGNFLRARDSFNVLNQIIKSKVLLSMILSWAITRFERLASGDNLEQQSDASIEAKIYNGADGIKAPDQTFGEKQSQKTAKESFKKFIPTILEYINNKDAVANTPAFGELPEPLRMKAIEIESDEKQRKAIQQILLQEKKDNVSITEAIQGVIVDDFFAEVFKQPGLSLNDLKRKVNSLQKELFLTSAVLKVTGRDKNKERLLKKMKEGLNEDPGGEEMEAATAPSSAAAADKKAEIQESNFNRLLVNGIDVLIEVLNDKEVNENRAGVLTSILNSETLESLGLGNDKTAISNYIPLLQPDIKGGKGNISYSVIEPLAVAIIRRLEQSNTLAELKKKLEQSISDKKKENSEYENTPFEEQLFAYFNDKSPQNLQEIKKTLINDVTFYHQNLAELYQNYNNADHLKDYKNRLETATLSKLLMLEKDNLGLVGGKGAGTNLLDMVLDLVEQLDRDQPDLADFFSKNSLTKYIKKDAFNTNGVGFGALKDNLNKQAEKSLKNIVKYVSELQGLRYLFNYLNSIHKNIEVVVFNYDQTEFIQWLTSQHSAQKKFLNPKELLNSSAEFPCCIIMSELAFGEKEEDGRANKQLFLESLRGGSGETLMFKKPSSVQVIPPIVLCSGSSNWSDLPYIERQLLDDSYAPVVLIEPALPLNSEADKNFPTVLSSAYLFAAQLMNPNAEQGKIVSPKDINIEAQGRCCVIGTTSNSISTHLKQIIGPDKNDAKNNRMHSTYAFDADYFLYVISLLRTCIEHNNGFADEAGYLKFINYFVYDEFNNLFKSNEQSLDPYMIKYGMTQWSLNTSYSKQTLYKINGISYIGKERKIGTMDHEAKWFNNIEEIDGLFRKIKFREVNTRPIEPPVSVE